MENKKKKLALIATSTLSLGVLSFVIVNNTLDKSVLTAHGGEQARTATANKDTTKRGLYASEGGQIYNSVAFSLNDENVYNIINTSQLQDGITKENNCVFALWGQQSGLSFAINTGIYSNDKVYTDDTKQTELSTVLFRHLNKIDFILDNSDDKRLTTLSEDTSYGTFAALPEVSENTVKWTWTANTFIDEDDVLLFSSPDEHTSGKAIWMREIVFYYDC